VTISVLVVLWLSFGLPVYQNGGRKEVKNEEKTWNKEFLNIAVFIDLVGFLDFSRYVIGCS
jgi:hypothetical protein